ncbi:FG-GAP-like repeat-containing protein [Phycicoccus sp. SLBN-51]|uniref:FG-GAP-like repeat-containing protein n=1 Tax=Phycicoccus sp. SLBN-51 TaxID=2768447 RepID=UPI00114FAA17|nr:FG-GAP-like repeat-containing protein [Phycicoccus sp. SLBN-51]TQJ50281.1 VCBS repeat protein [Phycicoccus sp. SLBN-51]
MAGRRMHRLVVGWLATVAAVAALLTGSLLTATAARAATLLGNDVSWPQCDKAVGGLGLPMPPDTAAFAVIGLTKGLPFTENPCLADQVAWATQHGTPTHAYTIAAFPTTAQLGTYGTQGPWRATTRAGQLSNAGYAEARFALQSLRAVPFTPPVVWVDVEPRPAQPWPSDTTAQRRENRYVVEGLMRGLRDAGVAYGVYSYAAGWQTITGSWWLPGVPVWATAGRLDYPDEALDRCTQASFSGGRVFLSQWYDDVADYDRTCEPYAFTPLPVPASTLSMSTADFNGDWVGDVLARTSTGDLRLYAGAAGGRLAAGLRIGSGWNGLSLLETPGDVDGDGPLDVLAREASTGYLWLYRGDGHGAWLPRLRVGTGWNVFNALVGPGDFTGDQRVDVLARRASTGELWLYAGNGKGGWKPAVRVGTGWNAFNALVGPGDVNGDGAADVLARRASTGDLWLYPGNGKGGWKPAVRIGTGWNGMTAIMSPGDLDGDRVPDVVARDRSGVLWLYPRTASGTWRPRVWLGTGWNGLNALF